MTATIPISQTVNLVTVAFNHFQCPSHLTDNTVVVYYKDRRRTTFRDIIGVNVRNTNTLVGKNVEFLSVMSGGTFNLSFNFKRLQCLTIFIKPSYVF